MPDRRGLLRLGLAKRPQRPNLAPNSLFGEILDWMLAPLILLWPVSIVVTNHVANSLADQPYDQMLADDVTAIDRLIRTEGGRLIVNLPASARTVLRTDDVDIQYFQVATSGGRVLYGNHELPKLAPDDPVVLGVTQFRDVVVEGEPVRIAYKLLVPGKGHPPVLVQVGETRRKRETLTSQIISGVLLPQFATIPIAVILVWFGLSRGISPLRHLQQRIQRRRPGDLSRLALEPVPDEVRPLVEAFNEMMNRLEANLQAQQRFIADAAHQMRTPLTGLKMQTELALGETDPERMRDALNLIAESTERAAHLINQLLALARAEANHAQRQREPVDLESVVHASALEWIDRALAKRIDLGFDGSGQALMIDGVPLLLRELLSNLIDNALKYTPAGGSVTVRTRVEDDVVLEVEDTGIGIAEEDRQRVFERFYRVLGASVEGSGLGLSIVAEIAELHAATIELTTGNNGQGCLFRLRFPRPTTPQPAPRFPRPDAAYFPIGM